MCASGIHNNPRSDGTSVLVTVGSACVKWNGTIEVRETSTGPGATNANPDGNKWSDVALKAQYNQANAVLDFYSPHYYGWMEQYYSSQFENTPAAFGMNEKPCLVGEMPAKSPIATDYAGYPTATMTLTTAFNNLLAKGWQGHFPWTANIQTNLTAEVGYLLHFGTFAQAFYNANKALVRPNCTVCSTTAPTVTPTLSYCQTATATATALTATGTNLLWYSTATGGAGTSIAPVPNTSTVGYTTYYVSQTVTGCEGPRTSITVTINAAPAKPTVTTPVNYTQGATASALTAIGTSLKWYTTLTGGTALAATPIPSTTTTGSTNYYVSQTTGTCESPRATIAVVVSAAATQSVVLKAGWNIIGCPISGSTALQSALSSIWTYVSTVKNLDSFYSSVNPPAMNSLTSVTWGQGYMIYVSAPCTLDWIVR